MTFWFKIRLTIFFVLFVPISGWSAFTEFYMTSGGSNLNAGSTTDNTATYTTASGNWVQSTRVFTVTDGTNPSTHCSIGQFASVFPNAASVGVYIGRISGVTNATNGTITIDSGVNYGSAPSNSTGGITVKVGGAWLGPNGATLFPFGLAGVIGTLQDTATDSVRLNAKNDQTYSLTAALNFGSLGAATLQGYTTNVGDLGKAIFTSNLTSAANFTVTGSNNQNFIDIIFANTGASNGFSLMSTGVSCLFLRCVFHGARGNGLINAAALPTWVIESEAYDCNKSNAVGGGAFLASTSNSSLICINCYAHDNAGSNGNGFAGLATGSLALINCISESNGGSGVVWGGASSATNSIFISLNGNYYNNTGDGIKLNNTSVGLPVYIANNNFLKNGGKAIDNTLVSQTGIIYNNGRGAGTQANGSSDLLNGIVNTSTDITYANDITPWAAPLTGNFSTVWAQSTATGAGRGVFTETGSGITPTPTPTASGTPTPKIGTVGFPDIGAAQAPSPTSTPSATPTATATPTDTPTPTPTATATASFTPCSSVAPTPTATPTSTVEVSYGFSN